MPKFDAPQSRLRFICAVLMILIPASAFYLILWRTAVNIPILDDYLNVLTFANQIRQTHGIFHQIQLIFSYQHNGYKLIFENWVVYAQLSLLGRVHMLSLAMLGNTLALVIFLTVTHMSGIATKELPTRICLLAPVAYLILQLQYASALNFASSSLQHLAVVAFSLLSINLMTKRPASLFTASCAFLVLAVCASPNGFFVAPVSLAILLQDKQWRRLVVLASVIAALLACYLFKYDFSAPSAPSGASAVSSTPHVNLLYALSFLGSSVARFSSTAPSIALGLLLCGVVLLAIKRRFYKQNPAVFYSMVFILINALAISGLRSDFGVAQSLASRYRTYSNLMLAFSYIFMVQSYFPQWKSRRVRWGAFAAALAGSVLFCIVSDLAGARFLSEKKLALTQGYRRDWLKVSDERTDVRTDVTAVNTDPILARQLQAHIYNVIVPVMQESVRLGVYHPPENP